MLGVVLGASVLTGAVGTMPDGRPTPTELDVPRWISLKSDEVSARAGPGKDYRILWRYQVANLPVQVIAETREWRKVCDPEGSIVWIHRSVAKGSRSVFNGSAHEVPIRTGRSETAPLRARLSARSLVSLDECRDGWCRVQAGKIKGWVQADSVFGTQTTPLCDFRKPTGPRRR